MPSLYGPYGLHDQRRPAGRALKCCLKCATDIAQLRKRSRQNSRRTSSYNVRHLLRCNDWKEAPCHCFTPSRLHIMHPVQAETEYLEGVTGINVARKRKAVGIRSRTYTFCFVVSPHYECPWRRCNGTQPKLPRNLGMPKSDRIALQKPAQNPHSGNVKTQTIRPHQARTVHIISPSIVTTSVA